MPAIRSARSTSARERRLAPARDNRARDAPTHTFLAIIPQHVRDLPLARPRQKLRRTFAAARIHAHVKRRICAETETAPGVVQLRR